MLFSATEINYNESHWGHSPSALRQSVLFTFYITLKFSMVLACVTPALIVAITGQLIQQDAKRVAKALECCFCIEFKTLVWVKPFRECSVYTLWIRKLPNRDSWQQYKQSSNHDKNKSHNITKKMSYHKIGAVSVMIYRGNSSSWLNWL